MNNNNVITPENNPEEFKRKWNEWWSLTREERTKRIMDNLKKEPKKHTIIGIEQARIAFDRLFRNGFDMITFPITPVSYQSPPISKKEFIQDIEENIEKRDLNRCLDKFKDCELEIELHFFLASKYSKTDLDNLTKLMLDSMKGKIFPDDRQIKKLRIGKYLLPREKYLDHILRKVKEQVIVGIRIV